MLPPGSKTDSWPIAIWKTFFWNFEALFVFVQILTSIQHHLEHVVNLEASNFEDGQTNPEYMIVNLRVRTLFF